MIYIFKRSGKLLHAIPEWEPAKVPMYSFIFDANGNWFVRTSTGARRIDRFEAERAVPRKAREYGQTLTLIGATR